jgi:hypothetical protein
MTPRKELRFAYGLAVILFVVGVVSYAAFPARHPEQPVRMMFHNTAGKVIFDHKTHASDAGYGISCADCHHHPQGDEAANRACGDCHTLPPEGEKVPAACLECHAVDEVEDTEITTRVDAFHTQCIGCHRDFEKGPIGCTRACHLL